MMERIKKSFKGKTSINSNLYGLLEIYVLEKEGMVINHNLPKNMKARFSCVLFIYKKAYSYV